MEPVTIDGKEITNPITLFMMRNESNKSTIDAILDRLNKKAARKITPAPRRKKIKYKMMDYDYENSPS